MIDISDRRYSSGLGSPSELSFHFRHPSKVYTGIKRLTLFMPTSDKRCNIALELEGDQPWFHRRKKMEIDDAQSSLPIPPPSTKVSTSK